MKRLLLISIAAFAVLSNTANAAVTEEDLAALKAQMMALMERVSTLEAENSRLKQSAEAVAEETEKLKVAAASSAKSSKSSWADKVQWKGDFRYRYENIDAERSDTRERNRIRARAALIAQPTDNTEVGIGIATGGDDPVSTNQTLGGGGSTKDVRLDLAYFKWQATPGLNVMAGKTKNIYIRPGGNGLIWDGDFRPEGVSLTYDRDAFFLKTGFNFLESDSRTGNSRISYGVQAGFTGKTDMGKFTVGASYFDLGTEGRQVFFGDDDEFFGNTFACSDLTDLSTCEYQNDFEEVEVFAEFSTKLGDMPISMFADYVQNQAADDLDTGWAAGFRVGKASAANTWQMGYTYQDLEADAVFGLLTDSDFGGGGTDAKGHIIKGRWAINKKWNVGFTYFINERNVDLGREEDYDRLQIDTAFKF